MKDTLGPAGPRIDRLTLIAMAVVAYALANIAHEAVGHGGACVLTGGRPVALSAIYFDCDDTGLSPAGRRWIAAAGTLANLVVSGVALWLLKKTPSGNAPARYFLWLVMTINLLQGAGYWLFSGLGNIGDWADFIRGFEPHWLWRTVLAVVGGAAYVGTILLALRELLPLLGADEGRLRRAVMLSLVPYLAGGLLFVVAGLPNPVSFLLVLISAVAASFGGTSALAWMVQLLRNERRFPPSPEPPLSLRRSAGWLVAAALTALFFIGVLGPAVHF